MRRAGHSFLPAVRGMAFSHLHANPSSTEDPKSPDFFDFFVAGLKSIPPLSKRGEAYNVNVTITGLD